MFVFQVEDTFQEGQEKEEQQDKENIKAEDNAIEMSEDFDGQMHDEDENEAGNLASLTLFIIIINNNNLNLKKQPHPELSNN